MLQQPQADDYVIATGETHSIRDFLDAAFAHVGIDDWSRYVRQDPRFMRPADIDQVVGDATKARSVLGWKPSVSFAELVQMMVDADLRGRRQPGEESARAAAPLTEPGLDSGPQPGAERVGRSGAASGGSRRCHAWASRLNAPCCRAPTARARTAERCARCRSPPSWSTSS